MRRFYVGGPQDGQIEDVDPLADWDTVGVGLLEDRRTRAPGWTEETHYLPPFVAVYDRVGDLLLFTGISPFEDF